MVEGGDLASWLHARAPTDLSGRLALFRQICAGVAAAHEAGFVHRDLKPSNVLVTAAGVAKVTDFGVAKILTENRFREHLTQSGTAMGTLGYMAPEQMQDARRIDHRADLWSLGCLLYELACRQQPFPGSSVYDVLLRSRAGTYTPPLDLVPDLPLEVALGIARCLDPEPDGRPATCGELADLLGLPGPAVDGTPPPNTLPAKAPTPEVVDGSIATMVPATWLEDDDS